MCYFLLTNQIAGLQDIIRHVMCLNPPVFEKPLPGNLKLTMLVKDDEIKYLFQTIYGDKSTCYSLLTNQIAGL